MRRNPFMRLLGFAACVVMTAANAFAQDNKVSEPQQAEIHQPPPNQPQDIRGNVLRQLGLTREQMQQIRRMNAERGPLMKEVQRRFREANRALDDAIYADEVSDADVQARLKDVQLAQAEIQRLRFMNELAVRRILTPEQLVRFRELRERFEQARENFENRRPFRNAQPMERPAPGGLRQPVSDQPFKRPADRPTQQKPDQ
jgi:Spy/CpxP family protein refolding chaperone